MMLTGNLFLGAAQKLLAAESLVFLSSGKISDAESGLCDQMRTIVNSELVL